jgi:hypothetical protein
MPKVRSLTPVQIETLGAVVEGKLVAERKTFGTQKYLGFLLPDGREVTRRVIALRKRGFLKWQGAGKIVPTPEGIHHWKSNHSKS